jgi:3-dehydroquinate synthase
MHTISSGGKHPYPIYVGSGILQKLPDLLTQALKEKAFKESRLLLVSDRHVASHHMHFLVSTLEQGGYDVDNIVFSPGEKLKSSAPLNRLLRDMVKRGMTRDATVLALGGGVVGDFAGYAASVYMRGCNLVQVPTSLLAQVDSSIGGKVGINLPEGKNLVGSFHNPLFVISDTDTLSTLPSREFSSGLAEIIKYGLIRDSGLHQRIAAFIHSHVQESITPTAEMIKAWCVSDMDFLTGLIVESSRIKAEIASADEHEHGQRMLLNFGHTFGHALEQATRYRRYLHGEAVFLGMRMATLLSSSLGLIGENEAAEINTLLSLFPVPGVKGLSWATLNAAMDSDKKKRGGSIHYVVLERIGKAVIKKDIPEQLVRQSIGAVTES